MSTLNKLTFIWLKLIIHYNSVHQQTIATYLKPPQGLNKGKASFETLGDISGDVVGQTMLKGR